MADVMMAESSSASLSRRQHLANTFEAYRAGLDADVMSNTPYNPKLTERTREEKG
jgi:hypothetical protein